MFKDVLQDALSTELDHHLGYSKYSRNDDSTNYRNGSFSKAVSSTKVYVDLDIPRDRLSSFEPALVKKCQSDISSLESKIISLYSHGLSTRDINSQINELYGINISSDMVSDITDKLLPKIQDWQRRSLDPIYPFVFLDALHCNVRDSNVVVKKAVYIVLGVNIYGIKDILGVYIGQNESSKFWLGILNDLKNRGVKEILISSFDGLPGFAESIEAVFPSTEKQRCIVHMIRNTLKFVSYKDRKEFANDLKTVYTANSDIAAKENLEMVADKWNKKYPWSLKGWFDNWNDVSTFFKYGPEVRNIIYTTNSIENLNRQYRKVIKTKGSFSNNNALLKIIYLVGEKTKKKWIMPHRNWEMILTQLGIEFKDRLTKYL
jgi:putative transposase